MTALGPDQPGREGREYLLTIHRVSGLDRPRDALLAHLAADLGGTCGIDAFFCEAQIVSHMDRIEAELAFEQAGPPISAAERSAQQTLLRRLSAVSGDCPIYELRAGWADAVGELHQGFAFVDASRGEVLWVRSFDAWGP